MKQESLNVQVKQEKGNISKFEMRAPPRRRAKGDEMEEQPVFLRKAFHMISICPPEIGGWSQSGDTVIIKNVKEFSEKVIPTAYKHNNFSSFVRQLNFYGFRKVKSESLQNPSWWEFRHPQFLRDQPQLLSNMKRSMHFVSENSGQDVMDLKIQVADLTEKVAMLNEQVERLSGTVSQINLGENSSSNTETGTKKRKVTIKNPSLHSISIDMPVESELIPAEGSALRRMNSLESNLMIEEFKDQEDTTLIGGNDLQNFNWLQSTTTNEQQQMGDDEDLLDCIGMDEFDLPTPRPPVSNPATVENSAPSASIPVANPVDSSPAPLPAIASHDVAAFLEYLSPELKLRFVDKLAEYTSMQMMQNRNVFPVAAATAEAMPFSPNDEKHDFYLPSGSPAPRIALPLASAALSAFMISNMQLNQPSTKSNVSVSGVDPISSRG